MVQFHLEKLFFNEIFEIKSSVYLKFVAEISKEKLQQQSLDSLKPAIESQMLELDFKTKPTNKADTNLTGYKRTSNLPQ